jgi:ABC-type sugar transport system permease subunit
MAHDAAVYRAVRGRRADEDAGRPDTMTAMDDPTTTDPRDRADPPTDTEPGDRPPSRQTRLDRPPSERYGPAPTAEAAGLRTRAARALGVALVGAAIIAVLGGPLSMTAGLLAVAVLIGLIVGAMLRQTALAVGMAVGSVVLGLLAVWLFSRSEGGVLDPLSYFAEVQGPLAPIQLVLAALAAIISSR